MNLYNAKFINGGGKSDSLTVSFSTADDSCKIAYQARHFGRFHSFHLKRTEAAEMACLFVVPEKFRNGGAA